MEEHKCIKCGYTTRVYVFIIDARASIRRVILLHQVYGRRVSCVYALGFLYVDREQPLLS